MPELHLPWLQLAVAIPAIGAIIAGLPMRREVAHKLSIAVCTLTLVGAVGAWSDFSMLHTFEAGDPWDMFERVIQQDVFVIDELSAPLLPLAALVYLMTVISTLRTKVNRFSFGWTLASLAILQATLSCREPWMLVVLLSLATIPPWIELRSRKRGTRVYTIHMSLFVGLLVMGQLMSQIGSAESLLGLAGLALIGLAALLRTGIVPLHCWMTDLFEKATFGTALLYVTPMTGAYAMMRMVVPTAPDWTLQSIAIVSLITAVYAGAMALVQHEARRFFCYLFVSHSSLVLVGMELVTPIGLAGALCVWLSVGLSLAGFGLSLRCVESRTGRITLDQFLGLYEHVPTLAALFLLTGLASIGFPGTVGFIGTELLIEGAVIVYPFVGMAVVVAMALNGVAILHAYFRIFTGAKHTASISLRARAPERIAVLILAALILGGGLFPHPGVASRYHAADALMKRRQTAIAPRESAPQKHRSLVDANAPGNPGLRSATGESES